MQLRSPLVALALVALAWSTPAQTGSTRPAAAPARVPAAAPVPAVRAPQRATSGAPLVLPKPAPRRLVVPAQRPVSYGSAERTKLLSQARVARDGQHYGSVERRAAIEGKRVQGSRQAPQHRRR
jgi:hypothetical protein